MGKLQSQAERKYFLCNWGKLMGLLFTPCSQKPGIIWLPVSGEIFPVQHMKMPFTVLFTLYHLQSEIEWNYRLQTSCCDLDSVFLFTL